GQHYVPEKSTYGLPIYLSRTQSPVPDVEFQPQCSDTCGLRLRLTGVTSLSIAVDYATVTRVLCIEGPGDLPYISMTMSQTLQTRYKVTWTSAFRAAVHTFRIKTQKGGMYLPIISYIWEDPKDRFWLPTLHLLDGRVVAVGTHSSPDSAPPGTDVKGWQVSVTTAEGSTQASVITKTVTCGPIHLLISISMPQQNSQAVYVGNTAISVDRASAAIVWTVRLLAPHSQGLQRHLGSDLKTGR
ncbi:hypothetical protein XENOCAPTIV_001153, partial [Xenoophorus captivus]